MEKKKRQIVITGFGKFPGVEKNPTETLVELIRKKIQREDVHFDVLEVSAQGTSVQLSALQEKYFEQDTIWIHLGVNMGIKIFNLEKRAYNCADFRCPDVRGVQLRSQRIVDIYEKSFIETSFSLDDICGRLVSLGHSVSVSQDAGRYLCNYVYLKSLYHCATKKHHKNVLFLHVPSFESISAELQCKFVLNLINMLEDDLDDDDDDDDDGDDDDCDKDTKDENDKRDLNALISMGFSEIQSREALKMTGDLKGDLAVQRAALLLLNSQIMQPDPVKMVILVRTDLKMSQGKIGSQCSHAALDVYRRSSRDHATLNSWRSNGEKIVVLKVSNQLELETYAKAAQSVHLPVSVICDAGRTEVASGTKTVVAIGPAQSKKIDTITGHLKLL